MNPLTPRQQQVLDTLRQHIGAHGYPPSVSATLPARFCAKVIFAKGECWEWSAAKDKHDYGYIGLGPANAGVERAHRVAWMLFRGPIPLGMCVLHRCDNPKCVNPEHLFIGTRSDNQRDMVEKGRNGAPSPEQMRGSRNPSAKLDWEQVATIRRWYAEGGISMPSLARQYGVAFATIQRVISKVAWQ